MRRVHFWQDCIARLLRVGQAANLRLFPGRFMASRFRVTSSIAKSQPARSPATAKHREVVEMQPGRSALLPCGDEWFGFSVVSKIDRYPIQESWMQIWSRPACIDCKGFLDSSVDHCQWESTPQPPQRQCKISFRACTHHLSSVAHNS